MSTLVTKWCSRASVTQRKGRTGRVCPGINIRLFPKSLMADFDDYEPCAAGTMFTILAKRAAQKGEWVRQTTL